MRFHLTMPAACAAAALPAFAALAIASSRADAASFDCAKAETPTEHAICDNPQLGKLDEQASGLYYQIISSGAPAATVGQVKSAQVDFLQQRNSCGAGYDCLISAYTDQIMFLKNVHSNLGL
jgi:uncharacterized protein